MRFRKLKTDFYNNKFEIGRSIVRRNVYYLVLLKLNSKFVSI